MTTVLVDYPLTAEVIRNLANTIPENIGDSFDSTPTDSDIADFVLSLDTEQQQQLMFLLYIHDFNYVATVPEEAISGNN